MRSCNITRCATHTIRAKLKRMQRLLNIGAVLATVVAFGCIIAKNAPTTGGVRLLNVSYDPTRELYQALNGQFVIDYEKRTGRRVTVVQSHGGSSRQARAVISGEEPADVVTLGLYSDVDAIRKHGLIASGWTDRLPNHSQPYTSTIVFVVRQGNPKRILDWPDLVRAGIEVITPNPRTSGNGKLSALAAWGAIVSRGGSEADARAYLERFYEHVPVLDDGARGSAMTFAVQEVGDVHLTWENEAVREVAEAHGKLQIVYPPVSILAEPYVAWVDANVVRDGTGPAARAYLEFLFSDQAQLTLARLGYRPFNQQILQQAGLRLPHIVLFPITTIARSWDDAQEKFFGDNGIMDAVLKQPRP
jgi:sulfate/thiosulfate transport system substrate-binding protein